MLRKVSFPTELSHQPLCYYSHVCTHVLCMSRFMCVPGLCVNLCACMCGSLLHFSSTSFIEGGFLETRVPHCLVFLVGLLWGPLSLPPSQRGSLCPPGNFVGSKYSNSGLHTHTAAPPVSSTAEFTFPISSWALGFWPLIPDIH